MAREVIAHRDRHGNQATVERYHLSGDQLKRLRAMVDTGAPRTRNVPKKANGHDLAARPSRQTYLLARKLKDAVTERVRTSGELGDLEIYATLLTRQLLE